MSVTNQSSQAKYCCEILRTCFEVIENYEIVRHSKLLTSRRAN